MAPPGQQLSRDHTQDGGERLPCLRVASILLPDLRRDPDPRPAPAAPSRRAASPCADRVGRSAAPGAGGGSWAAAGTGAGSPLSAPRRAAQPRGPPGANAAPPARSAPLPLSLGPAVPWRCCRGCAAAFSPRKPPAAADPAEIVPGGRAGFREERPVLAKGAAGLAKGGGGARGCNGARGCSAAPGRVRQAATVRQGPALGGALASDTRGKAAVFWPCRPSPGVPGLAQRLAKPLREKVTKLMEKKTKGLEAPSFPSVAVDVPDASGRTNPVAFMSSVPCACRCWDEEDSCGHLQRQRERERAVEKGSSRWWVLRNLSFPCPVLCT
ncbi:uncharacterized protein LOC113941240 [Corapipo altera]|uniref:uncharacterized protein LOC113941240 n=1 Tax=Corapipo altera TaxID=415028 RepID=UPI000FD6B4D4|nr:uncharacterized protein LOC113941240 [Corapipo altera]